MSESELATNKRPTDNKGRVRADTLTEHEALTECVVLLRAFADALEAASQNPMLKAMMPGMRF